MVKKALEIKEYKQENNDLKQTIQELNQSIQDCNIQRTKLYKALEESAKKLELALDSEETDGEESLELLYDIQEIIDEAIGE